MALREIRKINDEILRKKSRKVDSVDERIRILLDDMVDTMHENMGAGLAAVQVGILKRLIVIDIEDEHGILKIVNPEIIETFGTDIKSEGCLSVPGINGDVIRPKKLVLVGLNENGEEIRVEAQDLLARAICHEVDHLDGILFVDKIEE